MESDHGAVPQKCVELLRKQKLGVATFLILEKQQQLAAQMRQSAAPPEGEPSVSLAGPRLYTWKEWSRVQHRRAYRAISLLGSVL
jgi:hypothetical protein